MVVGHVTMLLAMRGHGSGALLYLEGLCMRDVPRKCSLSICLASSNYASNATRTMETRCPLIGVVRKSNGLC